MKIMILFILLISACSAKRQPQRDAMHYYNLALQYAAEVEAVDDKGLKQSLLAIDQALAYDQCNPLFYAFKGTVYLRLGHALESQRYFDQAKRLASNAAVKAAIMNNQACALAQLGQYEQACALWQELAQDIYYLTPEVAYNNQALVYMRSGHYDKACLKAEQAVQLAPDYVDAYYCLAFSRLKCGDKVRARAAMNALLDLEPDHPGVHYLKKTLDG